MLTTSTESNMQTAVPPAVTNPDNFMSPRQAAIRLGYELDYVYKLIWAGRLEAVKINGQWRIPMEAVNSRLQARV